MKVNKLFWILICLLCLFYTACRQAQTEPVAVSVIFDTDMGPDYDDVGALTMLHAMADSGEVKILATLSSNRYTQSVPCIEIINRYFGRPDIPLGAPLNGIYITDSARFSGKDYWPEILPSRYTHNTKRAEDAPDAVSVYRQILSSQPDNSVHIITVGFLTNLAALLQTQADEYSELDGMSLVKKKVKRLISMAGKFPEGWEFNVCTDPSASVIVFEQWPTPITLSGFEIGETILTGKRLIAASFTDSPVHDVFSMGLMLDVNGRSSWDQTAVLVGVRGYRDYFDTVKGRMTVAPNGSNTWIDDSNGVHERLVWKMPKDEITRIIEDMMMHQPEK